MQLIFFWLEEIMLYGFFGCAQRRPETPSNKRWALFGIIDKVVYPHIERLKKAPKDGWIGAGTGKAADISRAMDRLYSALLIQDRLEGVPARARIGKGVYFAHEVNPTQVELTDFSTFESMLQAKFSLWRPGIDPDFSYGQFNDGVPAMWGRSRASIRDALNIPRTGLYAFETPTPYDVGDYWTSWFGRTDTLVAVEEELLPYRNNS